MFIIFVCVIMGKIIIELKDVNFRYSTSPVLNLNNINLEINEGEFVGIMGESGSGKSTLIYTFNGLVPHFFKGDFKGSVNILNYNTLDYEIQDFADKVGFLFQNPDFQIFSPDVESEIIFGLENLAIPKNVMDRKLEWVLEEINVKDLRFRDTSALSGGQKQLVSLASILIMKPKILVLDEPTAFLDPIYSDRIFKILKNIQQNGTTIILVTHDAEILGELADRILVISKGGIVGDDTPDNIFSNIDFLNKYKLQPPPITKLFLNLTRGIRFNFNIPVKYENGFNILSELLNDIHKT